MTGVHSGDRRCWDCGAPSSSGVCLVPHAPGLLSRGRAWRMVLNARDIRPLHPPEERAALHSALAAVRGGVVSRGELERIADAGRYQRKYVQHLARRSYGLRIHVAPVIEQDEWAPELDEEDAA